MSHGHLRADGKTVLLAGATDGLGRALAADLAARGATPSTYMPTKIVHSPASTVADGVRAASRLIWNLHPEQINGQYFNVEQPARAHRQAYDPDARAQLRQLSAELTKVN